MEDSFKVQVDRIFGALAVPSSAAAASVSASSSLSSAVPMNSMWCLTDHEIQRKKWKRDKRDSELDQEWKKVKRTPRRAMTWPRTWTSSTTSARSAIGRDCTLDYEEEEDQYDAVAVGSERVGDHLYMKEFRDYGVDINLDSELPTSLENVPRDPRANHMAAKMRLKEDAEEASKIDSVHISEANKPSPGITGGQSSEENPNLKPILKRKDGQPDSKMEKRVRFDPQCMEEASPGLEGGSCAAIETSVPKREFDSAVPDYIRNPSRYTHYTFDSLSEMDKQSNRQAYMDLFSMLRGSKSSQGQEDAIVDLPKTIAFLPKKKAARAADVANFTGTKDEVLLKRLLRGKASMLTSLPGT
ncbi:hypothetical protein MLD38_013380 [Melastoma candidum]|uniref:Uncharacterized protein n=1 Tax=Melastoma candidum TaxID=119954 RepID=A0ACB9RB83_9MYRT|nr:hypothetical protein MLD38_013380 [Melastoma candidum]